MKERHTKRVRREEKGRGAQLHIRPPSCKCSSKGPINSKVLSAVSRKCFFKRAAWRPARMSVRPLFLIDAHDFKRHEDQIHKKSFPALQKSRCRLGRCYGLSGMFWARVIGRMCK